MSGDREFLPEGYEPPKKPGKYLKFQKGENRFRILDSPLRGWVAWRTLHGKKSPMRRLENTFTPGEYDKGKGSEPRHFWAMPVYDYASAQVKVLEITQSTIQTAITNLARNKKWGHPEGYDLVVTATGEGMEREYSTIPDPKEPLNLIAQAVWDDVRERFDIKRLLVNGDPFGEDGGGEPPPHDDEDESLSF